MDLNIWFCILFNFCCQGFINGKEAGHLTMSPYKFEIFPTFPNFLTSYNPSLNIWNFIMFWRSPTFWGHLALYSSINLALNDNERHTLKSETIFCNWKPFKNAFYFTEKAALVLKIILIFVLSFWSCRKTISLER